MSRIFAVTPAVLALAMGTAVAPAAAQEFLPPEEATRSPFWIGLRGFSSRFGIDVSEGDDQAVLSIALDFGNLGSERIRLRPSFELGFAGGPETYVVSTEALYRFTGDDEAAVPYVGLGGALFSQEGCGSDPDVDCPQFFLQFAIGFELHLRQQINWLIEYHGEDAFSRHRLFIGLSSRRGR